MLRNLLLTILLLCAYASAQEAPLPTARALPPHVISEIGVFERVEQGWRCRSANEPRPKLLSDLQIGDVLLSIDGQALTNSTAIGFIQQLRLFDLELVTDVEVLRNGQHLKWTDTSAPPQIIAAQESRKVLRSSVPPVHEGDMLVALGPTSLTTLLAQVKNPLTALANIEVRSGKVLHVNRDGRDVDVTAERAAMLRLLQFDLELGAEMPQTVRLHGLNTTDVSLTALRGRWTLLHFWATWCVPCVRHLPEIRDLAQQPNLALAAIGFADTEDRLSAAGAQDKDLKVYAPDANLQRVLAITGIPFDVLLDPHGSAVLITAGNMRPGKLRDLVMQYMRQ